ncbi:hypothetical protein [Aquabacterium sp.]|uniref:hypothetical protein n=1 Tax=Aquabacterium sp. TaxID=1872578 RepID=UPI0024898BEB|nr:hypothetical protein [Aquabacterium sp.]MDI1260392.1 hypothetical protein [Aquabacterium sp.]
MRKFAFLFALLFASSFAYADPPIPPPTLLNNSGNGTVDISGGATVSTSVTSIGTEILTATNISLTASDGTSFVAIDRDHTRSNGTNFIEITFSSADNSRYLTFDIPVKPGDPPTGYGNPPSLSGFIDYVSSPGWL